MDKSLKTVFIAIAIYLVLAIQFYFDKGILIIPYMFNPLTLFIVSLIIWINSFKKTNSTTNLLYFIGITIYCFTSERTLNLLYNYSTISVFKSIINSPFLRLLNILGFFVPLLIIVFKSIQINKLNILSFVLVLTSLTLGITPILPDLFYIAIFSVFVIFYFVINNKFDINSKYLSINNQLILFLIIENLFFIIHNYG